MSRANDQGAYAGYVGIDFGTANSGFSFLSLGEERPLCHYEYPQGTNQYPKTRTALLYKKVEDNISVERLPIAWGDTALHQYSRMNAAEREQHVYLENFKLALAPEKDTYTDLPKLTMVGLTPEQVITDYLRCLVEYARRSIHSQFPTWDFGAGTRWALTVPAGWGDGAKALMRRAAVAAGIASSESSPHLLIVHEPEAAAVACQARRDLNLNVGDTFMVVDAGGGTIDITWHKVASRGGRITLEDATHREGHTYGGRRLDDEFSRLLEARLGQAYTDWKADPKSTAQYMTFVDRDWCLDVKHKFDGSYSKPYINVALPLSLFKKVGNDILEEFELESGCDDKFPLKFTDVKDMFDQLVLEVKGRLDAMISRTGGKPPNKVLMVGGLGTNRYLSDALRSYLSELFGAAIDVVTPTYAFASIVEGAALYAKNPGTISARRSALTYSIRTSGAFVPGESPMDHRLWMGWNKYQCTNIFDVFVKKDDLVEVGEFVERLQVPLTKKQADVGFDVFATALPAPKYCCQIQDRPQPLASIRIMIDQKKLKKVGHERYILVVKMRFGTAELTVEATDKQTGESVATQITFMSSS